MRSLYYLGAWSVVLCAGHVRAVHYQAAIVGYINQADGIGGQSLGLLEQLVNTERIGFAPSRFFNSVAKGTIPDWMQQVPVVRANDSVGITLFLDMLTLGELALYRRIPRSRIIIAYSMIETDVLSERWVSIINNHVDLVIVPELFLKDIYQACGVRIPLYVVPLGLNALPFDYPDHSRGSTFVVGFSSSFTHRKNHLAVAQAFVSAFGKRTDVRLVLHGRNGDPELVEELKRYCAQQEVETISIIHEQLNTRDYYDLLASFDCYISLSLGEGYALGPREALALGIPCILSDHTAHRNLINNGFALPVAIASREQAPIKDGNAGNYFVADRSDAARCLQEVEQHYQIYHERAQKARAWIESYRWDRVISDFITFIRPSAVRRGSCNMIRKGELITCDQTLYDTYRYLESASQ